MIYAQLGALGDHFRFVVADANSLYEKQQRFEEAKALLRKTVPVARRVLGERRRVTPPHPERGLVTLREDPSRHG